MTMDEKKKLDTDKKKTEKLREQVELNDTGDGAPVNSASGGYGGTAETVDPDIPPTENAE